MSGQREARGSCFWSETSCCCLPYREKFREEQGEEAKHPAENLVLTGVQSKNGPGRSVHRYEAYWHVFC